MANIWFSSDWHYGHKNIVRGCSEWESKDACRNFLSLQEHNEILIQNINKVCKQNDKIFFGGDFSFGGRDNVEKFRKRINCKDIELIFGNHDHHIRKNYNNCQSLFTSCKDIIHRSIGKTDFVMCHYAMRTWDRAHHGTIMLYGHSHGTLKPYSFVNNPTENSQLFKTMDIGIDTHYEFRPYHLEEIRHIMKDRICLKVDHHNDKTN